MTPTNLHNKVVLEGLKELGIKARHYGEDGGIAIDRDSCHNAQIFQGMQEWDIIPVIPKLIKDIVDSDPSIRVAGGHKTDDEWFVQILTESE